MSVFYPLFFFSWKWLQVIISTSGGARHCPAIFNEVDVAIQNIFTVIQFNLNNGISLTVTCPCPSVRAGHYCVIAENFSCGKRNRIDVKLWDCSSIQVCLVFM